MKIKTLVYILIGLLGFEAVSAQELKDSVKIHFQTGKTHLDLELSNNRQALENITDKFQSNVNDSIYYRLQKVLVIGSASPEGSVAMNKRLSEKRAESLFNYLSQYTTFPDSLRHFSFLGRDWKGLYRLADMDSNLPYRLETLALLKDIASNPKEESVRQLRAFKKGQVYTYLYKNHFPALRASTMYLWYSEVKLPYFMAQTSLRKEPVMEKTILTGPELIILEPEKQEEPEEEPFYWALKTNLLYDAALIPNIGAEFYVGKNWSVGANWMYAWWSNRGKNNFWRIYGGDVEVRRWFGKKAAEKPLQGHHLGVYGQLLTYDFETGGRGYMADKWNYTFGVSYGYSLPIAKRLNLDFNLGIGYWGGRYKEYLPIEGHYVWQATKNRRWIGPTKAEVSLVWLLGHDNDNKGKGGRQ